MSKKMNFSPVRTSLEAMEEIEKSMNVHKFPSIALPNPSDGTRWIDPQKKRASKVSVWRPKGGKKKFVPTVPKPPNFDHTFDPKFKFSIVSTSLPNLSGIRVMTPSPFRKEGGEGAGDEKGRDRVISAPLILDDNASPFSSRQPSPNRTTRNWDDKELQVDNGDGDGIQGAPTTRGSTVNLTARTQESENKTARFHSTQRSCGSKLEDNVGGFVVPDYLLQDSDRQKEPQFAPIGMFCML
jgi:hypothetical protein